MPRGPAALGFASSDLARRLAELPTDPHIATSWQEGDLSGKLRQVQRKMKAALQDSRALKYIFNCSRRLGKSFLLCTDAIETGLKEPNAPLRFGAPTQTMMRKILLPIIRIITADAPSALRPVWKASAQTLVFPSTAAELTIAGCNNGHEENLRGQAARKAYLDEAGRIKNLAYVVNDILMPQLLTTGGRLIMASTPPKTPAHDFVKMCAAAELKGDYMKLPIHAAGYDKKLISQFMEEAGGPNSTTWRREYLCDFVVDEQFAIAPEWLPEYEREHPRTELFKFWEKYEAMDIGTRDKTAVLFAYYDFLAAKIIVEDEFIINGPKMTTKVVADGIKEKEKLTFGAHSVKLRIADNNNKILLNDLGSLHGLHFAATSKDTLEAMVNELRLWITAGRILVNPRCKNLIGCLRYGVFDDKRKQFERLEEYGHFDALAALIYLVRNVDAHHNPVPADYGKSSSEHFAFPRGLDNEEKMIKEMFVRKPKR